MRRSRTTATSRRSCSRFPRQRHYRATHLSRHAFCWRIVGDAVERCSGSSSPTGAGSIRGCPAAAAPAQALDSKYSESDYAALEKLITTTLPKDMDLNFLKKIYQFHNAKDMLKLICSRPDVREAS